MAPDMGSSCWPRLSLQSGLLSEAVGLHVDTGSSLSSERSGSPRDSTPKNLLVVVHTGAAAKTKPAGLLGVLSRRLPGGHAKAELEKMQVSYRLLVASHEDEMNNLNARLLQQLETQSMHLTLHHEKDIREQRQQLQTQFAEQLAHAERSHNASVASFQSTIKELQQLREQDQQQHLAEVDQQKAQHKAAMDQCQDQHSEGLATLRKLQKEHLQQLKEQHAKQLAVLEAAGKRRVVAVHEDWACAFESLQAQLDTAASEIDSQKFTIAGLQAKQATAEDDLADQAATIAQLQQQLQDKTQECANKDGVIKLLQGWVQRGTVDLAAVKQAAAEQQQRLDEALEALQGLADDKWVAVRQLQQEVAEGVAALSEMTDTLQRVHGDKLRLSQQLADKSEEADKVKAKLTQYNALLSRGYEGDARVQHVLRECTVNDLAALCIEQKRNEKLLPPRCSRILNPQSQGCVLFELDVARGDRREKQVAKAVPVYPDGSHLDEVQVEATNAAVCQRHGSQHVVRHTALVVRSTTYCLHSKRLLSSVAEAAGCSCHTCTATCEGAVWAHNVMERAECDLWAVMDRREEYIATPVASRIKGAASFGQGLAEMHSANVIHGDVKTDQVVLLNAADITSATAVDLDNSRLVADATRLQADPLPGAGTPLFMAPEVHFDHVISERSDMVGFALTTVEVVTGRGHAHLMQGLNLPKLYSHGKDVVRKQLDNIISGLEFSQAELQAAGIPAQLWAELWQVLRPCLRYNAGRRPAMAEVVADLLALAARWEGQ